MGSAGCPACARTNPYRPDHLSRVCLRSCGYVPAGQPPEDPSEPETHMTGPQAGQSAPTRRARSSPTCGASGPTWPPPAGMHPPSTSSSWSKARRRPGRRICRTCSTRKAGFTVLERLWARPALEVLTVAAPPNCWPASWTRRSSSSAPACPKTGGTTATNAPPSTCWSAAPPPWPPSGPGSAQRTTRKVSRFGSDASGMVIPAALPARR